MYRNCQGVIERFFNFLTVVDISYRRYLRSNGAFYGQGALICPGGTPLQWRSAGRRGFAWRCNGVIVNPNTGERCCTGAMRNRILDTVFYKRIGADLVLQILYLWLRKVRRTEIAGMAETSSRTVVKVFTAWYKIMQEDVCGDNVQAGTYECSVCRQIL